MEMDTDTNQLLNNLIKLINGATSTVRQFATCLLSVFFVVGLLLIVPALLQTAAAYVWAVQVRKETSTSATPLVGQAELTGRCGYHAKSRSSSISGRDRTLFLYRTLACVASLTVLVFSTLPQLVFVVSRPPIGTNIDHKWGWCHAMILFDSTTRLFTTYMIVVPFGLLFWNFLFAEIIPRHKWLTDNVFAVILRSSVPIILFSVIVSAIIAYIRFDWSDDGTCSASLNGFVYTIYLDFILARFIPSTCIFVIGVGFLRWLPHNDYGVLYEPGLFFLLLFPTVCCELTLHTFQQLGVTAHLLNEHFANLLLVSYAIYQMAFSSTFVVATMRSVVTEIREEMRKRKLFFLGDQPSEEEEGIEALHGSKRRTKLINGMQRQFSVAFRWKPEFTAEEQKTVAENPKLVMEELRMPIDTTSQQQTVGATDAVVSRPGDDQSMNISHLTRSKVTADDAVLHYTILQQSADLKKHTGGQQSYASDITSLPSYPCDLHFNRCQSGMRTPDSSKTARKVFTASADNHIV